MCIYDVIYYLRPYFTKQKHRGVMEAAAAWMTSAYSINSLLKRAKFVSGS